MRLNEKPFYTVEKVILTPKSEDAGWSIDQEFDYEGYDIGARTRFSGGDLIFDVSDWEWTVTYTRSAQFRAVADVVGEEKAEEVLRAMGVRE